VIGFLRGAMAGRTSDGCFLEVGGVGYRLLCSATTLGSLPADGRQARVYTHLHVREDALALFGFATEAEQRSFEALIGVNGVGPKVALQICSAFAPDKLRRVIATDDVAALSSVPGIGKKTAGRIVLDLKEKMGLPDLEVAGDVPNAIAEARSALENLGYSPGEVRAALGDVDPADGDRVEDLVRRALRVIRS
jgi:Holliday junction DNA helicase RuvA